MSAFLRRGTAPPESNQFIRPNKVEFDICSATCALALRGSGFAASPEYAKAISHGMGELLGQALERVLGKDGVDRLSLEDWNIVQYLSIGINLSEQVLPSTADAGGDEVAGSPVTSVAIAPCERVPSPPQRMNCLRTGPHWVRVQEPNLQRKSPEGAGERYAA